MAKREARSENVGVRFRPSELARLDLAAEQESLTRSEFIRKGAASLTLALQLGTSKETNSCSQIAGSDAPGTSTRGI